MEYIKLYEILNLTVEFAASTDRILAVGLCGSWARGTARSNSDIDLFILVEDKLSIKKMDWIKELNFKKKNEKIECFSDEAYGEVWSRHVFLESKVEIEYSFADKTWADTENLDEGTIKVVKEGFKIIYDPDLILNKLIEEIRNFS